MVPFAGLLVPVELFHVRELFVPLFRVVIVSTLPTDAAAVLLVCILIDEAQDLPEWAFEMASLQSTKETALIVAYGSGQELYRTSNAPSLERIRRSPDAIQKTLPRNFRNTEMTMKVARAYYECDGRLELLPKLLQTLRAAAPLLFDRPGGALPCFSAVDDSSLAQCDGMSYPDQQHHLMVQEFARILKQELASLTTQQRETDVLLLVPSERSSEREWVVEALQTIGAKYIDYTLEANRRSFPNPDELRLCTFMSARGIEGQRVIVFGLDKIGSLIAAASGISKGNLGYIVLSRASVDETIVSRTSLRSSEYTFINAVLDGLRQPRSQKGISPLLGTSPVRKG